MCSCKASDQRFENWMTLTSPYFDAQHLDQAVLCLAIAEVQHDYIQEIVLPLLRAILQHLYKLVITPTCM